MRIDYGQKWSYPSHFRLTSGSLSGSLSGQWNSFPETLFDSKYGLDLTILVIFEAESIYLYDIMGDSSIRFNIRGTIFDMQLHVRINNEICYYWDTLCWCDILLGILNVISYSILNKDRSSKFELQIPFLCFYRDIFKVHAFALFQKFLVSHSNYVPFTLFQDQTWPL